MRKGKLCILRVYNVSITSLGAGKTSWQATLPDGIVPQLYMSNALLSSSGKARVAVNTDRHVEISTSNESLSNATLNGQIVFPIQ